MPLISSLVVGALLGGAADGRARPVAPPCVAFEHAAVVPMDRERVLRDYTVVVSGSTITALGPAAQISTTRCATRVNARGKYLMPALADMHVHLLDDAWKIMLTPAQKAASAVIPDNDFLLPYVANGVTTVQVLSATTFDVALRERIRRGEVLGPRMILAPLIDAPRKAWPPPISTWVETPAAAAEAVRKAKAAGFDKIKAYSFLSREQYDSLVAASRETGMEVIGHIPNVMSVEDVVARGQRFIAHSEELLKHNGLADTARIEEYASYLASKGVWLAPTLVTSHTLIEIFDDAPGVLSRAEARYFQHPMETGVWSFLVDSMYLKIGPRQRQIIRDGFTKFQVPFTKAFAAKGGRILAGTDSPWPGLVPGFGLHRELREFTAIGLTPYQALRSATSEPFAYLGERDRQGTIAVGQMTDLLLVEANPLEDITAASRIRGVLMRGQWLSGDELTSRMHALIKNP